MNRTILFAVAIIMLIALPLGCTDKQPSNVTSDGQSEPNNGQADTGDASKNLLSISYPEAIAFNDYETQREVIEQNTVDESIFNGIREFSYESGSVILGGETENVCYSPLSLYMALAMLSNGANGETQNEILALLNETDTEYLSEQMGKLFRLMYRDNSVSTLLMANSLWINSNDGVKQEFVDYTMENFYAAANELDFNDPNAGDIISSWISDNTNGLLEPEIEIDPLLDVMYIVNTIYLKDEWQDSFSEDATTEDVFTIADGTEVKAEYMNQTLDTHVIEGEGFTGVNLQLKSTGEMTFILPDQGVDLGSLLSASEAVEAMINADNYENLSVKLSLPKFSFDSEFDLIQGLKNLGMNKAFDDNEADLTGIIDTVRANAYVDKVQQGTNITVNENGLEAAAYTYIDVAARDFGPELLELKFTRPFIFIVQSNEGVPMFIGVCAEPNKIMTQ